MFSSLSPLFITAFIALLVHLHLFPNSCTELILIEMFDYLFEAWAFLYPKLTSALRYPTPRPEQAPRIPLELHDLVIDHCANHRKSLLKCALVCRDWVRRSRHHLHSIAFNSQRRTQAFLQIISSPFDTRSRHIRSIRFVQPMDYQESHYLFQVLQYLGRKQAPISRLEFEGIVQFPITILPRVVPQLEELVFEGRAIRADPGLRNNADVNLCKLLSCMPNLKNLRKVDVSVSHGLDQLSAQNWEKVGEGGSLSVSTINIGGSVDPRLMRWLVQNCDKLEDLTLTASTLMSQWQGLSLARLLEDCLEKNSNSLRVVRLDLGHLEPNGTCFL